MFEEHYGDVRRTSPEEFTLKNLGNTERTLRIALGGAVAFWALWAFFGGTTVVWRLVDAAAFALGVDFVVTGIRGYCPLYKQLGWNTAALKTRG
ncbi:MAG: YgaP family membrane protein [Candidatus Acidiferrales bacterium]